MLREGTDQSQGTGQLLSNINACLAIADIVKNTLGPRGSDLLVLDSRNQATISNDGATILKLLEIVHPAAKTLVDIARSQDAEVGDGTTSVVLLAAQMLKQVRGFIEEGLSSHIIVKGFRKASTLVSDYTIDLRALFVAIGLSLVADSCCRHWNAFVSCKSLSTSLTQSAYASLFSYAAILRAHLLWLSCESPLRYFSQDGAREALVAVARSTIQYNPPS